MDEEQQDDIYEDAPDEEKEEQGEEDEDEDDRGLSNSKQNEAPEQESSVDGRKGAKPKKKPAKKLPPIRINLSNCKYEVLRVVQRKLGWREVGDDEDWEIYWTDTSVGIERIMKLTRTQKINHFNGMLEICRKKSMARNLSKMAKIFPEHYDFFPKTFLLPNDMQEFMADVKARGKKQIYILKPDAGCQGRGIRLVQGGKEELVAKVLREMEQPNVVAQHYLAKPLLVHGYKFDMRIYALVLSCDPLRVFIFREGLARFCTEKYTKPKAENLSVAFMHLTNYAVNKHNEHFVQNQGQGSAEDASKWNLEQLADYLTQQGHDWGKIWESIQRLIIKSLISVQPILRNNYRSVLPPDNDGFSCFEILGYDVMLDRDLAPWLIEVNHSPSFNIDSPLDLAIKEELISQTLELARIDPKLIAKAKKMEKRAAAGRLLEPLQKKKLPTDAASGPGGKGAQPSAGGAGDKGAAAEKAGSSGAATERGAGGGQEGGKGGAGGSGEAASEGSATTALPVGKPKTAEEYEAMRQEVLRKREKWEAKHSGGFTRIFPIEDRTLQGLYEELLRGAAELFQSTFQAKAKRALDAMGEDRRRREAEAVESDSVKAEKAKARALRDRLAQMALERRAKKAQDKQAAAAVGSYGGPLAGLPPGYGTLAGGGMGANGGWPGALAGMSQGLYYGNGAAINGAGPLSGGLLAGAGAGAGGGATGVAGRALWSAAGSDAGNSGLGGPRVFAIAGTQPRSEVWGEEYDGPSAPSSAANSLPSSRPMSARSTENVTYYKLNGSGQLQHLQATAAARQLLMQQQAPQLYSAGGAGTANNNTNNNQGALPPQPFRSAGSGAGDSGSAGLQQALSALAAGDLRAYVSAGGFATPGLSSAAAAAAAALAGYRPASASHRYAAGDAAAAQGGEARGGGRPGSGHSAGSYGYAAAGAAGAGYFTAEGGVVPFAAPPTTAALAGRELAFQYPGGGGAAAGPGAHTGAGAAAAVQAGGVTGVGGGASRSSTPVPGGTPPSLLEKLQPTAASSEAAPAGAWPGASGGAGAWAGGGAGAGGGAPAGPAAAAAAAAGAAAGGTPPRPKPSAAVVSLHEVIPLEAAESGWAANLGGSPPLHQLLQQHSSLLGHSSGGMARPLSAGSGRMRLNVRGGAVGRPQQQSGGQQGAGQMELPAAASPLAAPMPGSPGQSGLRKTASGHHSPLPASPLSGGSNPVFGGRPPVAPLHRDASSPLPSSFAARMAVLGVPACPSPTPRMASAPLEDPPAYTGPQRPLSAMQHQHQQHLQQQQQGYGLVPSPHPESHAVGVQHQGYGSQEPGEDALAAAAVAIAQGFGYGAGYTSAPPSTPAGTLGEGGLMAPRAPGLRRSVSGSAASGASLSKLYISAPTSLAPSPVPGSSSIYGQQQVPSSLPPPGGPGLTIRQMAGQVKSAPKGGSLYTSLRPVNAAGPPSAPGSRKGSASTQKVLNVMGRKVLQESKA